MMTVPFQAKSLVAAGFIIDGSNNPHPFEMRLNINEDFRFPGSDLTVIENILIDVEPFFSGIDLLYCLENDFLRFGSDDSLLIREDSGEGDCQDIDKIIEDNIKRLSVRHIDDDHHHSENHD